MFVYICERSLVGIRDIPSQFGCSVFGQEDHHGTHDRDHLGFINIQSVAKYEKTRRGTLLRH